jgi:hypothetical protein
MTVKKEHSTVKDRDWTARCLGFAIAAVVGYLLFIQVPNLSAVGELQSRIWGVSSEFNLLFGIILAALEALALSYVLISSSSSVIRYIGAVAVSGIFIYWMAIGIITVVTKDIVNIGLLGKTLPLPGGEWLVCFMIGMLMTVLLYELLLQKWHVASIEKISQ